MLGYIDEIVNTKQSYFPMAPELRPYQFQLEMDIHQGWHSGHRNVMAVSPVGSGKTTVFSSIMRKWPGPSIAIAHRQELVTQMSLALARNGVRHRIIAQPATIRMCVQMHMLDVGISYFSQTAPAGVAGVDTLVRRPADAWCNSVTLWIQDECFPAGTLVDGMPIETLRVGDMVTAFDEHTGQFTQRPVARTFKNRAPARMVTTRTAHHVVTSTSGHPFWTKRGWINACDLTTSDEVLSYDISMHTLQRSDLGDKRSAALPIQENRSDILHTRARLPAPGHESRQEESASIGEMQGMRGAFSTRENRVSEWVRVESVEIHERRGDDPTSDDFVYNIEVDALHTYVANGIVVHNCHHALQDNKWGIATTMFPNAYGLGVTATPTRTDGKGLGADTDGVFHTLVSGPTMRELIDMGYLSEYRIYAPPNNLHLEQVRIAAGGDFNPEELREAVHAAHIHGDVVDQYLKIASGKLGITFTVDVESAVTLAEAYRQRGVPAEAISGKTPANIRYKILQQFSRGEIKQICNCDVLGEGFDVPAIEVVSMARPTQSYGLYVQQFGRGLRIMDGKERAILIDHVGNTLRHGLPDATRDWSLDRRARRNNAERELALKVCPECTCVYERHRTVCPYCGYAPEPIGRALPEQVDGDLAELDPEVLAQMRGAVEHAMALRIPYGAPYPVEQRLKRIHRERVEAQHRLRQQMALWGGARVAEGLSISEAQRLWYLRHGVDVMSAQALNAADATELMGKIK